MTPSVIHEQLGFGDDNFWKYGKNDIIMREVPGSPYNTDNAWEVLTVVHFHDTDDKLPVAFDFMHNNNENNNDEENTMVQWVDVNNHGVTDKIMVKAIDLVVKKHGANERHQTDSMIGSFASELNENHSTMEQIADKMEKVEAQHSIIKRMDEKLETLTSGQVTSQHSITEQMKSQQSAIEQIANEMAEMKSQNTTTPSIDHNGDKLDTSATYQLLLDFDGSKVYSKYEKLFQMKSNLSTVSIISL